MSVPVSSPNGGLLELLVVSRVIPSGGSAALAEVSDASVVAPMIQHVLIVPHGPSRTADAG